MTYCYAQINASSICYAILQTYAEIVDEDMIPIPTYDGSYLGKRWTGTSWEDVPPPPEPTTEN
jgi:hypothetical protein